MKRYNAFTIQVNNYDSYFWAWLDPAQNEYAHNCPSLGGDIFWFDNPPNELFKYSDCFNWINGSVRLWHDNKPVTRSNYRTLIQDNEEEFHYEYLNWQEITNVKPIIEDQYER